MSETENVTAHDLTTYLVIAEEVASVAGQMGHHSAELQQDWQNRAQANNLAMFVVRDGIKVIASVNLLLDGADEQAVKDEIGAVPAVIALDVKPDYWRQGIGSKLMDACEDYVREHTDLPRRIALGVVEANAPARAMYEERGYQYHRIAGKELFDTSWPEISPNGNIELHIAHCLLMVKNL